MLRAATAAMAVSSAPQPCATRIGYRIARHHHAIGQHGSAERLRIGAQETPLISYSATIITLDGSDTNAYGEACEPGAGYTEQSGHWDPDRAYWQVHAHRDDVTPDLDPPGDRRSPAQWLADRLTARLGSIASVETGHTFYGAREAVHPGRLTGPRSRPPGAVLGAGAEVGDAFAAARLGNAAAGQQTLTAAAHADGFTDEQLTEAAGLLGLH